MNVLITGATGYLGSHLALDLVARGHQVTAVARARSPVQSESLDHGQTSLPARAPS